MTVKGPSGAIMPDSAKSRLAARFLISATIAWVAIYGVFSISNALNVYWHQVDDAKERVILIAEAVERTLDSDLRGVALSVTSVARMIENAEDLSAPAISGGLETIEDGNPLIAQTAIIGSDGIAVSKQAVLPSGVVAFHDRRYFAHHKVVPGDGTFIDGPFDGRLMLRPYLTVSQRLEGPADEFLGVVVAAIDLNAYGSSLARLMSGAIEGIAIYRDDGTLMLRVPDPQRLQGMSFAESLLFTEQLDAGDAGAFLADSPPDDMNSYVGFARVGGFPLIATASIPEATATAQWHDALIFEALKSLIVLAGAGTLMGYALYGLRWQARLEREYSDEHTLLRKAEARHRSLIDALPANVALVDSDGTILAVNADWRQFARVNTSGREEPDHHTNYLAVCEAADGVGDEHAARVANGLRTVLSGDSQRFDLDYPCHSPTEQRWFHLSIAPIDLGDRHGAVAMHFDVTARKVTEISLSEERERLRRLTEGVPGVVFHVSLSDEGLLRWHSLSDRCRDLFGISPHDALEREDFLASVLPPDQLPAVSTALNTHLHEGSDLDCQFNVRRPDGQIRFVRAVAVVGDTNAGRHSEGIFLDVTVEREALDRLADLTKHDVLTGLLNRTEFLRRLDETLPKSGQSDGDLAVLVVGIDDFSDIGDAYGMEIGDAVLRAVAERISSSADDNDLVGRISSERFAILQRLHLDSATPADLAESIIGKIREPLDVPGQTIALSVSIGVARPEALANAAVLVTGAERALRVARSVGRGTFRFDQANSGLETQTRLALRSGLTRALANGEFVLHYQPRVRLADGGITGCEALLRWQHPVFGMQSPAKFIPVAEHSGQIVPIGNWVLEEACRQAKHWLDTGYPDLRIAVNVSAVQVTQSDLVATVERVLAETGLPTSALELEMTEAVAFDQTLRGQLDRIHALGVSIAIDDFGTGFSSLGTLRDFPLDILKIDQSFVRKAQEVTADRVIVGTVIDLARGLELMTVAEGVETIEQAVLLHSLGCDEIQGYYIAVPMEAADFRWFLESGGERVRRKLQPLYTDAPQLVGKG